jgi:hypothetical protein
VLFKTAEMEEEADQFGDTGQVSPNPGDGDETQLEKPGRQRTDRGHGNTGRHCSQTDVMRFG